MMGRRAGRLQAGLLGLILCGNLGLWSTVSAADWVHEGQVMEGRWTAGLRGGISLLTQEAFDDTNGDIGPAVNGQLLYGLNKWFAAGLMVEWERRGFDIDLNPAPQFGTLNTVSLLPTLEFRPGRFGSVAPYLSTGIGVNVNSFSGKATPLGNFSEAKMNNTLAFRLAGGIDYPLSENVALNMEVAWKRNRGTIEDPSLGEAGFDATSMNLLFGLRMTF
jgi:outer membrane protein